MIPNLSSNPLYQRAQEMARGKSSSEIKEIALNICKEKGINFDDVMYQFQQQFKGISL